MRQINMHLIVVHNQITLLNWHQISSFIRAFLLTIQTSSISPCVVRNDWTDSFKSDVIEGDMLDLDLDMTPGMKTPTRFNHDEHAITEWNAFKV